MQCLRHVRFLARLVLAWFALAIGVAAASPLVQPQSAQFICSDGVMKLQLAGDGAGLPFVHTLDCPLCGGLALPPASRIVAAAQPLERILQSIPAARLAARIAAPLPARGPPTTPPA
jgi:hypothetical protein